MFKAQWGVEGLLNDVVLLDISKGGCFISSRINEIKEGDSGILNVTVHEKNQRIHCKVTWLNHEGEHNKPEGFGCSFRTSQKTLLKNILDEHGNLDYTR